MKNCNIFWHKRLHSPPQQKHSRKNNIIHVPKPDSRMLVVNSILSRLAYNEFKDLKNCDWNRLCLGQPNYISKLEEEYCLVAPSFFYDAQPLNDTQAVTWISNPTHTNQKRIHISFRGTESHQDVLSDLDVRQVRLQLLGFDDNLHDIYVHSGFYRQFNVIKHDIFRDVIRQLELDPRITAIYVTGHSLGGALATLCAFELACLLKNKYTSAPSIHCHTFGSPRVGNAQFAEHFANWVDDSWRVANKEDPVPLVPMSFRFNHVDGQAICINDDKTITKMDDIPWYVRLWKSLFSIDVKSPIGDHNCDVYISRLMDITEPSGF